MNMETSSESANQKGDTNAKKQEIKANKTDNQEGKKNIDSEEKKVAGAILSEENFSENYPIETKEVVPKGNDKYVDYLSQGGSIFELAKMLDLEQQSEDEELHE